MSISATSLFLTPVLHAEVDPPVPESTQYTMFLPSGTPLATIARAKLQEGTLGFSWAVDRDLSQPDMAYQHNQTDLERGHPASAAGKPYFFSGRLLTATDFGAEQEASVHPGAGAAAARTSSDLHAGTPGETLARSLPASRFDAVALNPQPLPPKDINELVQWVLRESYISTTEDLRIYAEKVKYCNDAKKQVRDELHRARAALGEVDSHIKGLEDKLNSVGDDAQLANVDLQNVLQKQQQTLQMMSNISKLVHDTAMSVIRKIGG